MTEPNPKQTTTVRTPDGVDLVVHEWGAPDRPAILLIHGFAQCSLCFAPQYSGTLARNHRLVAVDLRGHGASSKPLDPRAYQEGRRWADDIAAVIAAKNLVRPVLVGWSMGGRVIREYLIHHGDGAIGGLNFVGSRPIEAPNVRGPAAAPMELAGDPDLEVRLRAAVTFLRGCFHRMPSQAELDLAIAYNALVPTEVRLAIAGWPADPSAARAALGKVRVPTLVTHGALDKIVLPAAAEATCEVVPGARLSLYEDCGHSPFVEHPDRFDRELAALAEEAFAQSPG